MYFANDIGDNVFHFNPWTVGQKLIMHNNNKTNQNGVNNTKLVIASTNQGKILDFKHSLADMSVEILNISDIDTKRTWLTNFPPEDGLTFADNALVKARYVYQNTQQAVLADDSGLVVPSLGGAPGVKSARWGNHLPQGNLFMTKMHLVWQQICAVHAETGYAIFVCSLAFVNAKREQIFHGELLGKLVSPNQRKPGKYGFGYDAMFVPCGYEETFAEMSPNLKRSISHRAIAIDKFKKWWQA